LTFLFIVGNSLFVDSVAKQIHCIHLIEALTSILLKENDPAQAFDDLIVTVSMSDDHSVMMMTNCCSVFDRADGD